MTHNCQHFSVGVAYRSAPDSVLYAIRVNPHNALSVFPHQAHAQTWIIQVSADKLASVDDRPIRAVLTTLFRLYAVFRITEEFGDFIEVRADVSEVRADQLAL